MRLLATLVLVLCSGGCALTGHSVSSAGLGTSRRSAELLGVIDTPGSLTVETINSADWEVEREGLINLAHPRAKSAGLKPGPEPIQIYFHVIRHPTRGTFLIDTGIEQAYKKEPSRAAIRGLVASYLHFDRLAPRLPLGDWLKTQSTPLAGVFFTHLHIDHVSGVPDVPRGTPLYAGPNEAREHAARNLVVKPNMDRAFLGQSPIGEWAFKPDPDERFKGVIDVFGDGTLWALSVPGHTPGSTAYLARTTTGPVLFTGDVSHTAWGWDNDVEPGTFTSDRAANADSLARLRRLCREHPALSVRLGHQQLPGAQSTPSPGPTVAAGGNP